MNRPVTAGLLGLGLLVGAASWPARAQIAGSTTLDLSALQVSAVAVGWSAKKQIIGREIFNETGAKVGKVDDLIITPDDAVSFAIVGVGGFLGVRRHHVAIPVSLLTPRNGAFELAGASKQLIQRLPAFDYQE